ncbi:MAG: Nickel and cobalt efflux transporter rcnA [uncultured Sulfurovum sp.]|uniref:Nickel and cobalt efflux transporter rcnA n=1 Tax=uncultured Sulfurovum sp. TaxID=269237 RepID=A0A6S6U5I5_9BACT|nr:MAG: Nickel and cobalt efflux transporter rcnA [uncultured Sulfurovum sp.]
MEFSLLIILYYGVLHALGPDHLSAIALFSIGKKKKETFLLSLLFAAGHGLMLYLLALFVSEIADDSLLEYGDVISSGVILLMGLYLIYLAITNKIRIDNHEHDSHKHIHIYYKDAHFHDKSLLVTLGLLMGVGGIRGMLVTLSVVSHQSVGLDMVLAFIVGVSIVFLLFGYFIYLINTNFLQSANALRYGIFTVGLTSVLISTYNLSGISNVM